MYKIICNNVASHEIFHFPERNVIEYIRIYVRTCNNLVGRDFLSVKAWSLLTERDYVLVDEVSLITHIVVGEQCCTCKYIGRILVLACRRICCLSFSYSLESSIIELVNIGITRNSVVTHCTKLVTSVNILVQFVNIVWNCKGSNASFDFSGMIGWKYVGFFNGM